MLTKNNETLRLIAVIATPFFMAIIGSLLYMILAANTREHNMIFQKLDTKVSNKVLIEYMKLQEEKWKYQYKFNETTDKKIKDIEEKYLYKNTRGEGDDLINYNNVGSFVIEHQPELLAENGNGYSMFGIK